MKCGVCGRKKLFDGEGSYYKGMWVCCWNCKRKVRGLLDSYKIYIRIETPTVKLDKEFCRIDFEDAETWIRTARRWVGDLPEDKGEDEE